MFPKLKRKLENPHERIIGSDLYEYLVELFQRLKGYLIESVMCNVDNMIKISRVVRRLQYIDYLLEE